MKWFSFLLVTVYVIGGWFDMNNYLHPYLILLFGGGVIGSVLFSLILRPEHNP